MSATAEVNNPTATVIGRHAIVHDLTRGGRVFVGARVIDKVAGTNLAKRVRLTTGEHVGEVRMPGEYTLMEFTD